VGISLMDTIMLSEMGDAQLFSVPLGDLESRVFHWTSF